MLNKQGTHELELKRKHHVWKEKYFKNIDKNEYENELNLAMREEKLESIKFESSTQSNAQRKSHQNKQKGWICWPN